MLWTPFLAMLCNSNAKRSEKRKKCIPQQVDTYEMSVTWPDIFRELLTGRPRTRQKNIITLGLRILVDFVPLSDPIAFRVAQNTALLSDERINLASASSFWAGGVWVGPNILKYYVRADILKIISFPNHPTIKYPHSVFNISTLLSIKIQKY